MASIEFIKASDGSGDASVATVQSVRAPLATTIVVDTVLNINPAGFAGSMGTPHTFTDPVTSETITVISEATCVNFTGHVDGSNLEIDTIDPGYTDNGSEVGDIVIIRPTTKYADNLAEVLEVSHNDDGTLKPIAMSTVSADTVSEYTSGNGVTVDGLNIKDSKLNTADSVVTSNYTDGSIKPEHLVESTGTSWAWQTWSPSYSNITVGNGTVVARYIQIGKTVFGHWHLTLGSTSSMGTAPTISLPVSISSNFPDGATSLGVGRATDASGTDWATVCVLVGGSLIPQVQTVASAGLANISSTNPFTWTTTDILDVNFMYEAA